MTDTRLIERRLPVAEPGMAMRRQHLRRAPIALRFLPTDPRPRRTAL